MHISTLRFGASCLHSRETTTTFIRLEHFRRAAADPGRALLQDPPRRYSGGATQQKGSDMSDVTDVTFRQVRAADVLPGMRVSVARATRFVLVTATEAEDPPSRFVRIMREDRPTLRCTRDAPIWVREEGASDDGQPDIRHGAARSSTARGSRPVPGSRSCTMPDIDWDKIRSIDDVVQPVPFAGEGKRLDTIAHGTRVVDRLGNRYLLMGWGSVQGSVILRDRHRQQFHADGGYLFKVAGGSEQGA